MGEVRRQKSEARRKPIVWLAVLLVVCLSFGIRAAAGGTIDGAVLDPSGRAVAGARVSLLSAFTPLAERATDASGRYRFEGLRAGTYRIVANAPGFSALAKDVALGAGENQSLDLHLTLTAVEEHVVVSAALGGALAPEVGSSTSVVTGDEIEDRGAQNVFEALRGVPGVEINQTGRSGGVANAFIRGGNSNYNLVMVDGIELNQFGGLFDVSPLVSDAVERVEVTRGPASALYGSNAVAGVINVVTRRGEGPAHFEGRVEGGSFTTRRFSTGASGITRGVGWSAMATRLDSGGVVPNDRYRNQAALLSLGKASNPRRQAALHFFGDANDAGAPGPFGSDPDHLYDAPIFPGGPTPRQVGMTARDKQNLFGINGSYSQQFGDNWRFVASGNTAKNDYYFISPDFGDSYSKNLRGAFNARAEWTVASRDFLVGGIEDAREQIKNTFIADASNTPFTLPRTIRAAFLENRWNASSRVFLTAGARLDDFETHGLPPDAFGMRPQIPASSIVKVNPRLAGAFLMRREGSPSRLGSTRLHASFGTGIRAPDGFELAFTNNPRLKPEKSVSFDAGVEQRFLAGRAVSDLVYFHNRFEDQIVTLGGSLANLSTFVTDNLGNSRAQGVEWSLRGRPSRSLEVSGEYTFLSSELLAVEGSSAALSPFRVGQPLIRRPKHSGTANVTWRRGRLMMNANTTVRGSVLDLEPNDGVFACSLGLPCLFTNSGYVLANAGFAYQLPRGVELYGRLNNFLNRKYEESFGFPALHANFLAGVKVNFPAE